MAPFAERKFAPILAHNDLSKVGRVLDVGCGPGTNTRHFEGSSYLGLDLNERYVTDAHCRYGREFRAVVWPPRCRAWCTTYVRDPSSRNCPRSPWVARTARSERRTAGAKMTAR